MFDKGDNVWFWMDEGGWRTGVFLGVVEKGYDFGMYRVKPNFMDKKEVRVLPEEVEAIEPLQVQLGVLSCINLADFGNQLAENDVLLGPFELGKTNLFDDFAIGLVGVRLSVGSSGAENQHDGCPE